MRAKNTALKFAGTVFAMVFAAHVARYFRGDDVIVGGVTVPVSLSLIVGIIALILSAWMFAAADNDRADG